MVVSTEDYGEAEYIADNYGHCALGSGCECLKPKHQWLGRACPNWRHVPAKTIEELRRSHG